MSRRRLLLCLLLLVLQCGCLMRTEPSTPPPPDPPLTFTPPAETSGSLFDLNFNPSNSLESDTPQLERPLSAEEMMDSHTKSRYDELKRQKADVNNRINELDNMRRSADYEIIQVLSSGGAKMGSKHQIGSGDVQSVYEDPHIFIQNKQWEREFAVNEIVEKQRELRRINQEIDTLLEEATRTCFPAATGILMDNGTLKPIEEIRSGDRVMVYDIARDALDTAPVEAVFSADNNHAYLVNDQVQATAYERFLTREGWKIARELTMQDELYNGNAFEPVTQLVKTRGPVKVYNLRIDTAHNFFVSGDGQSCLLVHNTGGGGGGGGGK